MGTVFLLAGAFFVCSTLLSMRSVLADPIAPMNAMMNTGTQSPRSTNSIDRSSPRTSGTTNTVSRVTGRTNATVARGVVSRTGTYVAPKTTTTTNTSRTVATSRPAATSSARPATTTSGQNRAVVSRTATASRTASPNTANRAVVSRSGTTDARISLQGSAIRGSKASVSNKYTYLSNALYTGNYSNIIDPTTGLISSEAYNNCMESYYACMDEICTARNAAQRRCACAGRVKAFAEAEQALESANEELIKVSGELALLIASKGKDVSEAFQLTDAEKVMNCVSWKDASKDGTADEKEFGDWCEDHALFDSTCSNTTPPSYCEETGNNFGFNWKNLDGSGSDILASLKSWAEAKNSTETILKDDNDGLNDALSDLIGVVDGLAGIEGAYQNADTLKDSLAETWGYELFEYAHNNVCNRVLDSCFNGIYEACGAPPSGGRKCGNGASQCPFNYNSYITVSNTGSYELNFIEPNTGYTASNSATCFGYTTASGDPYANLRGPVADARRSIMQKYALDANADCDAYGEQLRTTAQTIGYQKVAAQQALQQKRLEFAQEEATSILNNYKTARSNFNQCLSELYDCYTTQERANSSWSTSRIKTYCAQVSNVPHCYDVMICSAPNNTLQAVIDKEDISEEACNNSSDIGTNTCRNVITIAEILNGSYADNAVEGSATLMREQCLESIGIEGVRNWTSSNSEGGWNAASCPTGQHLEGTSCVPDTRSCTHSDPNSETASQTWNTAKQVWDGCQITNCKSGYTLQNGLCVQGS